MSQDLYKVILSKFDSNRFLGLQLETDGGTVFGEAIFPLGFTARPDDASDDAVGCTALGFDDGDDVHAMPVTDPNVVPNVPLVKAGGAAFFAPSKRLQTFLAFDGTNGGVTLYSKDGVKAHSLNFDHNTHAVYLQQMDGAGVVLTGSEAVLRGPDGSSLTVGGGKAQVFGNLGVTGSISQVGGEPVVPVSQLAAFLGQLITVLAAHETAMASNVPTIVPAVLSPTLSGFLSAITGTEGALLK